jgi:hypothetical protein
MKRSALDKAAFAVGIAAGVTAAFIGFTWWRYGRPRQPTGAEHDALLDRFLPVYDVAERHSVEVAAPADVTFAAACEMDLLRSPIARAIFKAREMVLGADPDPERRPRGILALTQQIGWRVLAEIPSREVVVGAVTQPWNANVVFRGVSPGEFAAFAEPGYVKIAWTLRADSQGESRSIFRTETRAVATDDFARAKFRRYWAAFSPGIRLIRRVSLAPLRSEAERRARANGRARPQ